LQTLKQCQSARHSIVPLSRSTVVTRIVIRPHRYAKRKMRHIVTDVSWCLCLCVCLSVCWSQPRDLQKRSNRSRCPFMTWTQLGPMNHVGLVTRWRPGTPRTITLLGSRQLTYSTYSTLFARRQQRCDLWLPVPQQFVLGRIS